MPTKLQRHLASVFLKIFLRDRQSIFFSLFFPIIFMTVFGFVNSGEPDAINIGVTNNSSSDVATDFVQLLIDDPIFDNRWCSGFVFSNASSCSVLAPAWYFDFHSL